MTTDEDLWLLDEPPPDRMDCYVCGKKDQKVVISGVGSKADPTEWYGLECGHVVTD